MKIYCRGEGEQCETCCKAEREWLAEAHWRRVPETFKCSNCEKDVQEWALEANGVKLEPPDVERWANDAELRQYGWGVEGDDSCISCGLHTFDGDFPICEECRQCEECGCLCEKT